MEGIWPWSFFFFADTILAIVRIEIEEETGRAQI